MAALPLHVRALGPQDCSAIAALYRESRQAARAEPYWRWKFEPQAPGIHNRWAAFAGDRAVFHYAGIPRRFRLNGGTVTALLSVDALTASEFRRRGVLTEAAAEVYRSWREAGAAFTLGMPNQQWGSRTRALGWQALFPLRWFALPLRPFAYLARRFKLPPVLDGLDALRRLQLRRIRRTPAGLVIETAAAADVRFDEIWTHCQESWPFCAERGADFVAWRFFACPDARFTVTIARREGRPVGYAAYRNGSHSVLLADLFAARDDPGAAGALLDDITARLLDCDAEALLCLLAPGHPFSSLLHDRGFVPRQAFGVELVPFAADLPLAAMHEPDGWHLTGADFDVV